MSSEDPLFAADPAQIKLDDEDSEVANATTDAAASVSPPAPTTNTADASSPSSNASASADAGANQSSPPAAAPADRTSAMRTEVPTGTWLEQWNATSAKIKLTNPDLIIKVASPELVSSFMSK